MTITLEEFQATRKRISKYIRRTPMIKAKPVKHAVEGSLYLKLENMQITGSFKARGAVSKLRSLPTEQLSRGITTASGGNHGLGVAYAGWLAGVPTTIYLSSNVPPIKAQKLQEWGAKVIFEGEVWDDANEAAMKAAKAQNIAYFHPFADTAVIAGQGTIALEVLEELPDMDTIYVAIGGGGLISGVSLAAKLINPSIRVIGIEPVGAPKLHESLKAGHVVELAQIATKANTLAPRKSDPLNFDIIRHYVDDIVLVTDDEMTEAARWLWNELGVAAELSGAAATAAVLCGKVPPAARACALVCGTGTAGIES